MVNAQNSSLTSRSDCDSGSHGESFLCYASIFLGNTDLIGVYSFMPRKRPLYSVFWNVSFKIKLNILNDDERIFCTIKSDQKCVFLYGI